MSPENWLTALACTSNTQSSPVLLHSSNYVVTLSLLHSGGQVKPAGAEQHHGPLEQYAHKVCLQLDHTPNKACWSQIEERSQHNSLLPLSTSEYCPQLHPHTMTSAANSLQCAIAKGYTKLGNLKCWSPIIAAMSKSDSWLQSQADAGLDASSLQQGF